MSNDPCFQPKSGGRVVLGLAVVVGVGLGLLILAARGRVTSMERTEHIRDYANCGHEETFGRRATLELPAHSVVSSAP